MAAGISVRQPRTLSLFCDDCERGLVMTVRNLRAALTAILLGTAAVGTAALVLAVPAQALTVSSQVGPLLNEAKALMASGNYPGALAKLREAEAVKSTPADTT